jgi:hypothetical protein
MKPKKLTLIFRLGAVNPRPFSELAPYQGFVFEIHAEMQDPYIQIKLPPNKYAFLTNLIIPSTIPVFEGDYCQILTIEGDPICYPLF